MQSRNSGNGNRPKKKAPAIRILIADNHPVVREGLAALIHRQEGMALIAEAASWPEAVEQFDRHKPDLALLEPRMPGMDGASGVRAIREKTPDARIVLFTACDTDEDIYRGLRAGAKGYLLKDVPRDELIESIRAVGEGKTCIPPAVAAKLASRMSAPDMTSREMEVLQLMAQGKSNKEIGSSLNISEGTVKVHINHILGKLNASGRTEATSVALKRGLVRLD